MHSIEKLLIAKKQLQTYINEQDNLDLEVIQKYKAEVKSIEKIAEKDLERLASVGKFEPSFFNDNGKFIYRINGFEVSKQEYHNFWQAAQQHSKNSENRFFDLISWSDEKLEEE